MKSCLQKLINWFEIFVIKPAEIYQEKWENISSVESQKGVVTIQRCYAENQKGTFDMDFVQW